MQTRAKLLIVAASYEEMFSSIFKLMGGDPHLKDRVANSKAVVKDEIAWAKQTFKNNNAWVTWWLRWYRLAMLRELAAAATFQEGGDALVQTYQKEWAAYKSKASAEAGNLEDAVVPKDSSVTQRWHRNFEHIMATPCPDLQAYRPGYKSMPDVWEEMQSIETEWRESRTRVLTPQDGDKIIIRFPDGWAWWMLDRNRCDEEARSMGHCGNGGSRDQSQRILSLRQPKGQNEWEPHCTFILEGNGNLGEMKGRNNDKPVPRYHPYIIELLKNPVIKGITGGGYLPGNNFSMKDLTPAQREDLYKVKPELMLLSDYFDKFGADESLINRVVGALRDEVRNVRWSPENKVVVVDTWKDRRSLIKDRGNKTAEWVQGVLEGDDSIESGLSSEDEAAHMLDDLPPDMVEQIGRILAREHKGELEEWLDSEGRDPEEDEFDHADEDDILSFAKYVDADELMTCLSRAYETGVRYGAEEEMSKALDSALDDSGYLPVDPVHKWDCEWIEGLDLPTAIKLIESMNEEQYSFEDAKDELKLGGMIDLESPHYGFGGYDKQAAIEDFGSEYDPTGRFEKLFGKGYWERIKEVKAQEQRERKERHDRYMNEKARIIPALREAITKLDPQERRKVSGWEQRFNEDDYEAFIRWARTVVPDAFGFYTDPISTEEDEDAA